MTNKQRDWNMWIWSKRGILTKNNNNDSLTEKINNIEKNKNPDIYSSWSLPSDNIRRVQFATKIISDTYTIREKHSLFEIPTLFYTHDESIQFTRDYNRCVLLLRKLIIFYHIFFFHRFFYFSDRKSVV